MWEIVIIDLNTTVQFDWGLANYAHFCSE
jgi:hypothetical protein